MNEWLSSARQLPENQGEKQRLALTAIQTAFEQGEIKDPRNPHITADTNVESQDEQFGRVMSELFIAVQHYILPHTPEFLTHTHQAIWQARGELVGVTYEVTPYPLTQEQLADLEASGKRLGYLPPELATQQTRHKLGEMFPKMQSHSVKVNNSVTNDQSPSGWFDYEAAIEAPYLGTNERELEGAIKEDGRTILSLNQYIVASQDNKFLRNQYLDETATWVRLGSRGGGRVVYARFYQDGRLYADWRMQAGFHNQNFGGRSSGVNIS